MASAGKGLPKRDPWERLTETMVLGYFGRLVLNAPRFVLAALCKRRC